RPILANDQLGKGMDNPGAALIIGPWQKAGPEGRVGPVQCVPGRARRTDTPAGIEHQIRALDVGIHREAVAVARGEIARPHTNGPRLVWRYHVDIEPRAVEIEIDR